MKSVPFFDYKHGFVSHEEQILSIVRDVGRRGAFIMQSDLADFEAALADYVGARHLVGVGNATDAMEMSLSVHGIGPGDEVLVSAHTMIATASAVASVGATPVPVDIGDDNLMDPSACAEVLNESTRAILITQLNGRTAKMEPFLELAAQNDLLLFEDSAQGLGSRYRDQAAGTFGRAGCLSFYPAKTLGCLGDGGAIICNDDETYETYLQMRDHGRGKDGDVHLWGRNSRLDNMQAAILHMYLNEFDQVVARRREIASLYEELLTECGKLTLPPGPNSDPNHFDTYQNYELLAEDRDALKSYLHESGVGTLVQWGGKGIHQFSKLGLGRPLPNADRFFQKCIMLPMNMSISDEDVEYVAQKVIAFYE